MPDVDVTVPVAAATAPATVNSLAQSWVAKSEAKAAEAPKEPASEPEQEPQETNEAPAEEAPEGKEKPAKVSKELEAIAKQLGVDPEKLAEATSREFAAIRREKAKAREKAERAESLLKEAETKASEATKRLSETEGLQKEVARMVEHARRGDFATAAEVAFGMSWDEIVRLGEEARKDPARAEVSRMRRELEARAEAEAKAREAAEAEHRTKAQQAEFEAADRFLGQKIAALGNEFAKLGERHAFRRAVQSHLEANWDGRETISIREASRKALADLRREHGEWSSVLGNTTGSSPSVARETTKKHSRSVSAAQSGGALPPKAVSVRDLASRWAAKHGG